MIQQFLSNIKKLPKLSLFSLGLGYLGLGWLLAAFNAPFWIWCGTLLLILYLAKSGIEAVFIANLWIVIVMFFVTIFKPWPEIWPSQIPKHEIAIWATTVMILWLFWIILTVNLAFAHQRMKSQDSTAVQCFST